MNETCLRRPTQRAVDNWDSPRFLRGFNTSAGFRFQALRAPRPPAGNASRWAARLIPWGLFEGRVELLQFSRTPCEYTACAFEKRLSLARPHLLRMVSRMTQNHAGATASRNHVPESPARYHIAAQQCVHPTSGSLRVF